jgi:outer membrane protein assembly factor BamB
MRRAFPHTRRALAAASVLSSLLLAGAGSARADWRQFHAGPARVGVSADTTLSARNVDRLKIKWSRATGRSAEGINSSPVVADGSVYVGSDDGRVYSYTTGGSLRWSRGTGGQVSSTPAVSGGSVFVGSEGGSIYALSTKSGAIRWKKPTGGPVTGSPLVANGVLYIGSRGGDFYALEPGSGATIWKHNTWAVWDGAAYWNGTVYVTSDRGRLFAFNAATGKVRWEKDLRARGRGTPAVAGGKVFVVTDAAKVQAFDATSGRALWSRDVIGVGNGVVRCAPAVAEGRVVVTTGEYYGDGTMGGHTVALSAKTGAIAWKARLGDYATSSPAYANGLVYLGSFDHRLYALSIGTGKEVWTSGWAFQGGFFLRGISGSPAITKGRIYIGVRDGRLYSLGLP